MMVAFLLAPGALAQDSSAEGASNPFGECPVNAPSEDKKLTTYSLYYENYKNDDFQAALPHLRWMLRCAPAFGGPGNKSAKNLNRAINAYEGMAKAAGSAEETRAYLDSALMVIEMAPSTLEQAGVQDVSKFDWTFDYGYFIAQHSDQLSDLQDEAVAAYREAYEISPEELVAKDSTYYLNAIYRNYANQGNTKGLIQFINDLQSRFGNSPKIMSAVDQYVNEIPTKERIAHLEGRLEENPNDPEIIQQLFSLYRQEGMRDKMYELGQRMLDMKPTPETYRVLANMYREDGESKKALNYYEELMAMNGAEITAEDYYHMGLAQQNLGRLSSARSSFRQAIEQNSNYGRAYMAIGDLYAAAVQQCMSGTLKREDKAVYWLAVDKYQQAKSADSSLAERANQKINTYRQYFPSQEDLFFWSKTSGDAYQVNSGCYSWINESTTVRKAS